MMVVVVHLKGYITEDGKLQIHEPEQSLELPPGEVDVTVKTKQAAATEVNDDVEWTEEELKEALTFHPVPANQMVIEPWNGEPAAEDSLAALLERRRKKREARRWQSD